MKLSTKISNFRRRLFQAYMLSEEDQKTMIEIQEQAKKIEHKPGKRTLSQNRYLHKIIQLYCCEVGSTLDEAKFDLKMDCNFMHYIKNDRIYPKSSADLDTKELTDWIEWIRNYAGMRGINLPTVDDYRRNWNELEKTIEQHKHFL